MKTRRLLPAGVAFIVFASLASACNLPELDDYKALPLAQTSFLYASDGSLITELHATEDRVVLRKGDMPAYLRDAVVAIEDRRFYYHHGVDGRAIARAAYMNAAEGTVVEGGSTITQQLVKILYVGSADTLRRKIDEAALAWQLEDRMSKDRILTKYLNTVYFGEGAYGVQAAAQTYFSVDAADLTVSQAAILAGLITAPNHFDPFLEPESAYGRRNVVLRLMRELEMVDEVDYRQALREPIVLDRSEPTQRYPYPYFVDYFKEWFLSNPAFGETRQDRFKLLFTGGLQITTTLDPKLQGFAQTAVRSVLAYPGDPDGAMTVIDPRTGYVRAMVGGDDADYWKDTNGGRVNLATGKGGKYGRQTGSAFKPFALVTALENGLSPSTTFSAPATIDIPLDNGTVWHVTNAEGSGYGSMSLESATVNSVNTVYAQLMEQLGPENVIETAERMGLRCCPRVSDPSTPLEPNLSAVLGTNGTNTLSMAAAYDTLATGGQRVNPVPVVSVTDAQGRVMWQASPKPKQVVDPDVVSVANDILQEAVSYGTGRSAIIGRPQIGKTGTGDTHTNAWFVGAIPQLTAAVWVGFGEGLIPMEPPAHPDHRVRRHLAGTDLAPVHDQGGRRAARSRLPDAAGRLRVGRRRRHPGPHLPAERLHLAPEHRHPGVHLRHRAHEDVFHAEQGPVRPGAFRDRHGSGLGRGRARRSRVLRGGPGRIVDPARWHGDLPDPIRRHLGTTDQHRHDHGRSARESERLSATPWFGDVASRSADPASPSTGTRSPARRSASPCPTRR